MHHGKYFSVAILQIIVLAALPASAQRFYTAPAAPGAGIERVATGGASAWASDWLGLTLYRYVPYELFQVVGSNPSLINSLSVGGGSVMQNDEVWLTDSNSNIYRWNWSTQSFYEIPGALTSITVGAGYTACHPYEVWGINSNNQVFRYDYCSNGWDSIPGYALTTLATGGGEVWGLNTFNNVFRFNFSTNQFDLLVGSLAQISVGAGGVWGADWNANLWQFDPFTQSWDPISNPEANQISAGADGVFASQGWPINQGGVYRLDASTRAWTTDFIDVQPGGQLSPVVAGSGGGVWVTDTWNSIAYYYLSF